MHHRVWCDLEVAEVCTLEIAAFHVVVHLQLLRQIEHLLLALFVAMRLLLRRRHISPFLVLANSSLVSMMWSRALQLTKISAALGAAYRLVRRVSLDHTLVIPRLPTRLLYGVLLLRDVVGVVADIEAKRALTLIIKFGILELVLDNLIPFSLTEVNLIFSESLRWRLTELRRAIIKVAYDFVRSV